MSVWASTSPVEVLLQAAGRFAAACHAADAAAKGSMRGVSVTLYEKAFVPQSNRLELPADSQHILVTCLVKMLLTHIVRYGAPPGMPAAMLRTTDAPCWPAVTQLAV